MVSYCKLVESLIVLGGGDPEVHGVCPFGGAVVVEVVAPISCVCQVAWCHGVVGVLCACRCGLCSWAAVS